jgi:AraC family transcriptional regulator
MHKAMQLLKSNNVTETAMVMGYSNFSHFSTAFRKQFGMLPKEARREIEPILQQLNS